MPVGTGRAQIRCSIEPEQPQATNITVSRLSRSWGAQASVIPGLFGARWTTVASQEVPSDPAPFSACQW